MATIAIINGPQAGERYELGERATIGRNNFCDIHLNIGSVSREHARIVQNDGVYYIEDLNSQNGTFLNKERIRGREPLNPNDKIHVYQVLLVFLDGTADDEALDKLTHSAETIDHGKTEMAGPSVVNSIDARSDSRILANPDEKWRAALSLIRNLGRSLDIDEVLSQLLDDLFAIFTQADRGYVLLLDDNGRFELKGVREDGGTNIDHTLGPIDQSLARRVADLGEALLCVDEDVESESVLDSPARTIMCAPLISPMGNAVGVIAIDTKDEHEQFNSDDLEMLVGVSSVAGQMVELARQHTTSITQHQKHAAELEAEIARRTRIEENLRRSNAELQQFAYVASHDLQEPLRAIAGYSELLQHDYKDRLDDEANIYFVHVVEGAKRMQRLIDGLLEYSRIRTRSQPLEPVDCNKVFNEALVNLSVAISETGAEVINHGLPTIPADGQQLVQLFQNLIGNAIKFHGNDPPHIVVDATQEQDKWRFAVRDNGIGIAEEFFDRIFTVFQRLHTREKYPGTGIGLALCKRIAERHGGRIWVKSQPDQGSVFYVTIPLNPDI